MGRLKDGGVLPMITSAPRAGSSSASTNTPNSSPTFPPARARTRCRGDHQDLFRPEERPGPEGHLRRFRHALHGEKVRDHPPGNGPRKLSGRGRQPDHPGICEHDQAGRHRLCQPAGRGIRRHAGRFHRRGGHLRRDRRRDGSRSAHRGGHSDR